MKIIKIGALWCNACNVMKPRWKKIEQEWAQKHDQKLNSVYYDFDDEETKEIIEKYDLGDDIPIFLFLDKNEAIITILRGQVSEKKLVSIIEKNINE